MSAEERLDALARAQVWRKPAVPIAQASLAPPPPSSLSCRFRITDLGGTAQKFDCTLDDGEQIRVKYGKTPEIPSEVAASRLLRALGFAADEVTLVERVRCYGCPLEPFVTMKAVDLTDTDGLYKKFVNYDTHRDFEWVAVERKHHGRPIATDDVKGWAFFELDTVDAAKGGAPRAHVDALRLLAVFLAHWDNKSENQRLVCLSDHDWPEGGTCRTPFAMLQDIGGAFGPRKVDLEGWRKAPIWDDRAQCVTSMATLPYEGATFRPVRITEAGRRHLAGLLESAGRPADYRLVHRRPLRPGHRAARAPARRPPFRSGSRRSRTRSARSATVGRARSSPALQRSGVNRFALAIDRLEEEAVVGHLCQHEGVVRVVTPRDLRRQHGITRTQ